MSILKKVFGDFVDARQLRRASRDLFKQRQQAIELLFEADLAFVRDAFAETPAALRSESFPDYPGAVWTGDLGVNAFYVMQDVEVEQFPVYVNLVTTGRERLGPCRFVRDGSLQTFFSSVDRYSGKQVSLLTNDAELVRSVSASRFNPPPPWLAWYELGPLICNLQGDAQYWYENVWDKYWESLSLAEQDEFIQKRQSSASVAMSDEEWADWLEAVRTRDARYRERRRNEHLEAGGDEATS
ncbi:hypothetical protein KDW63_18915 [Burkholderia cenocepacia]|uniref:hypothetical protein n=1 Tax=Burkholderia cenocepacia TaxID=95486 RepID=UPI001B9C0964|nr:hypothetical protein [Burkholderia cenocepacia]MBR8200112.1 hypothetical protein [Burkholderia cenocepacia]MBR8296261.1 hypothetical protein [Burkholderia cenocepacia]HDV6330103.1 hypothetical protein [Burkholderia cenocepacia]HDV6356245.1 hypothetical protein [Burkholderia cenocepacia]